MGEQGSHITKVCIGKNYKDYIYKRILIMAKFARFKVGDHESFGLVENDIIIELKGDIFKEYKKTTQQYKIEEVNLLAPTTPITVIGGPGVNYYSHEPFACKAWNKPVTVPKNPTPFLKGNSCLIGSGEAIVLPKGDHENIWAEGELVVVIGKECCKVSEESAMDFVFGYTCTNDVTNGKWLTKDMSLWRTKGADTFGPVGPWIETDISDPHNLDLEVRVNGEIVQKTNTSELVHKIQNIIAAVSQFVTLFQEILFLLVHQELQGS